MDGPGGIQLPRRTLVHTVRMDKSGRRLSYFCNRSSNTCVTWASHFSQVSYSAKRCDLKQFEQVVVVMVVVVVGRVC